MSEQHTNHFLAMFGKTNKLIAYLEANPIHANLLDIYNTPPLFYAVYYCIVYCTTLEPVLILINYGANIDYQFVYYDDTPWYPFIDYQIDKGDTPLISVCNNISEMLSYKYIKLLVKNGANIDTKNYYGNSALLCVCGDYISCEYDEDKYISAKCVTYLVKCGAIVDLKNMAKEEYNRFSNSDMASIVDEYRVINWNRKLICSVFI